MSNVDRHDWHSAHYVQEWVSRSLADDDRRAPRFRLMADLIPFPAGAAIRILDVGAGYGALTRVMLESFPNAAVVAHDYSSEMLLHARKGLASYGKRVEYHVADLFSPDWLKGAGGPFQAVVSSLCIHNLQSAPRIAQIYREIQQALAPGGCFLNIDLVNAPTRELQGIYWSAMTRRRAQRPEAAPAVPRPAAQSMAPHWPPFAASTDAVIHDPPQTLAH